MPDASLEVTFRHGHPLAAYDHLPHPATDEILRSRRFECGLVVDDSGSDDPLGIEITAPDQLTLEAFNSLLHELGLETISASELAPLHAA